MSNNADIVGVKFRNKYNPEVYNGLEYSYRTAIKLEIGDIVVVPAGNGEGVAQVTAVNVPESKVDERFLPILKTIEKMYDPESDKDIGLEQEPF